MNPPIDWLLEGEPWIEYRTRLDLLGQSESDPQVSAARLGLQEDPAVISLVSGLAAWPGKVISSHKSAGQPFHRLTFLADLGLRAGEPVEPAVYLALLRADRAVLAGDHLQLPPTVLSAEAQEGGLGVSLFERLVPLLKPGGYFGSILPTTNQVSRLLIALHQHRFSFVEVCEIILRFFKPVPDRLRPTDRMVPTQAT